MRFRLTPRSMTLDDFELLQGRILTEFRIFGRQQLTLWRRDCPAVRSRSWRRQPEKLGC